MSKKAINIPNAKTLYASHSYPITADRFPVGNQRDEATRSNKSAIPTDMFSSYMTDRVPQQGHWNSEIETKYFQHPYIPSATYVEGNSADEPITTFLPIQLKNASDQNGSVPCEPPPSYDQLFAQKDENKPKITERRTSIGPNDIISSGNFNANRIELESSRERRTSVISTHSDDSENRSSLETQFICLNACRMMLCIVAGGLFAAGVFYYIFKRW